MRLPITLSCPAFAAREAQEAMEAAQRRGEPVPDPETRFDSNCITPGTREQRGAVAACVAARNNLCRSSTTTS